MEPWQWALACLGAFFVGLAKTGVAGLGVLTVAIYASILPARESVGVLLVVLVVADVVAVTIYRRDASWSHLVRLLPWAALGVLLGVAVFGRLNDVGVRRLIGAILAVLVVLQARRGSSELAAARLPSPWTVGVTGLVAGFTTMVANAAGPLMTLYLLAMRLPRITFVGTAAWFFLVLNLFKLPFSYGLGLVTPATLALSLRLAPFAVAGALSGRWLIVRMDQRTFESAALLLTFLAAIRLLLA